MKNNKIYAGLLAALLSLPAQADIFKNPLEDVLLTDSSRVFDLDEVIVVSQPKESFLLRQQPLSCSMFSQKEMDALGVRDLQELSAYVPSFTMPAYGSRYTSSMYVRGIGSRINSPAVGIYVDGMPLMSKSAFNFHNYGIERVDVLRGPQGTLYGQNTEGGLIRLYSIDPMRYQGTDIQLGIGSRLYRNAEITHYHKVSDKFAFSIGGFYNGQNGFFRNATTGDRADRYNEAGSRLRLVYRPTEQWDIQYLADWQYVRQNGFPYGILDEETGRAAAPSTNRQGNYRRNIFNTSLSVGHKGKAFDFNSTTSWQFLKDYMLMDIDYLPQDFMYMEERQLQNALTQEFDFKGFVPYSQNGMGWHWTAGAFGSYQWNRTQAPVYFEQDMDQFLSNTVQQSMYQAILNAQVASFMQRGLTQEQATAMAQQIIERAGGISVTADLHTIPGLFHTPQFNLGIFHESVLDITPRLSATLGLRYDFSHVKIDYETQAQMDFTASVMGQTASMKISSLLKNEASDNFDQLLPKLGLTYKLDRSGSNLYLTVSKSYRAGGYNYQMFSDILQSDLTLQSAPRGDVEVEHSEETYENIRKTISYKPETSWNYEAGTHLNLMGNALHLDIAAYYMSVHNQQLSVMAGNYGFGRMMVNAGKSYSCGVELSLNGSAFDNHLSYGLSYSYTHAAFRNYKDTITVNGQKQEVDYKDNHVPYVPQHIAALNADYRFDFNASLLHSLTVGADVHMQGPTYWDEANNYKQKFYAVLGAHVEADFGKLKLNVWARNLTQTRYNTFAVESAATGTDYWFAQRGNPFQCGVQLRMHL